MAARRRFLILVDTFPPIQRDEAGNVIATHEHAGELKEPQVCFFFSRRSSVPDNFVADRRERRKPMAPRAAQWSELTRRETRCARSVASHYFGRQKSYQVHLA